MSTFPTEMEFDRIDQLIRILAPPEVNTLLPAETADSIEQLLTVYRAVRPLLVVFSGLPLLPPAWRAALTFFVHSLDAVEMAVTKEFKAGKDL